MTLLDEKEKLLLARARQEFTPEKQQAHRVHAAVLGSAALGGAALAQGLTSGSEATIGAGVGPAGGAGAAGAATGGKLAALSQAIGSLSVKAWLTALAVTTGVSAGASLWVLDASEPATSAVAPKVRPSGAPPAPAASPRAALPAATPSATPPPAPPSPAPLPTEPSPASLPAGPQGGTLEPALPEAEAEGPASSITSPRRRPSGLGTELSSVRDADRALNTGDPARALAILDELDRSPGGALRQERAALRALAHCQLETPSATDRARRFLRAYPGSVYAQRVRSACEP
ncbi:MAG TPA: hypothetical protein VKZ49_11405 [Polyangiaceae bacterium]|nr:hypothetical protein [Polyangiaceae bacterium]